MCNKERLSWGRSCYRPAVRQYVTGVTPAALRHPQRATEERLTVSFIAFFVSSSIHDFELNRAQIFEGLWMMDLDVG